MERTVLPSACPICHEAKWHTENGLANHVWHEHSGSQICMGHGRSSRKYGNPSAPSCQGKSVMARCALRIAQGMGRAASVPHQKPMITDGITGTATTEAVTA